MSKSKSIIAIVVIIIVIIAGVLWINRSKTPASGVSSQTAATNTSVNTTPNNPVATIGGSGTSDTDLANDAAAIDAQISALGQNNAAVAASANDTPTPVPAQ